MLIVLFCAILPAFLLVFYIWLRDKYQREPISQILKGVFFGILSCGIAYVLEVGVELFGIVSEADTWLGAIWNAFLGAAFPEEIAKLTMLWLLLRKNPYFDERFDGIVYACCVGMGFAGTENILYLFSNLDSWESVAIQRAIFSVPGHFMFAVAMGYFYSKVHFREVGYAKRSMILLAPVFLHGVYDGLLFMADVTPGVAGILLIGFYGFCFWMFRYGRKKIQEQSKADDPNNIIFRV